MKKWREKDGKRTRARNIYEERPAVASTTAMLRLDLLRTYKLAWLPGDILAGLVIFAVTIPAALAYGQLAGLHAINGLYASLLAMGVYAFFGTSRQLIIDAEAAVAILVASPPWPRWLAGGDPARFASSGHVEAIMVGVILLVAGVVRIGFIADFIPKSVVIGFLNGMALIIILAQAGKLLGIELTQTDFFPRVWEFFTKIHEAHRLTLIVGGACLLGLFLFRLIPKIPEAVLVVVLATVAVIWWNLETQGIKLVGLVPAGLPHPELPHSRLRRYRESVAHRHGRSPGLLCGHHHNRAGLCHERRLPAGSQPGVDRFGAGQCGQLVCARGSRWAPATPAPR